MKQGANQQSTINNNQPLLAYAGITFWALRLRKAFIAYCLLLFVDYSGAGRRSVP